MVPMELRKIAVPVLQIAVAMLLGSSVLAIEQGTIFRDCPECPEMITIPAGTFLMGSPPSETSRNDNEGPQHPVAMRAFAIGVYDITRVEYSTFIRETGHSSNDGCIVWTGKPVEATGSLYKDTSKDWRNPGFLQTERDPVVCVSWEDAQAYVRWLNGKLCRLQKAHSCSNETGPYRLPTEAEWQYAARGGTGTPYYWGIRATHDDANYGMEKCPPCASLIQGQDLWEFTSPVGSFAPNSFGLFDVSGNVYQWVEDCWHDNYVGAPTDGTAWTTGECKFRVSPGSDWLEDASYLRVAYRDLGTPDEKNQFTGFRIARTLN